MDKPSIYERISQVMAKVSYVQKEKTAPQAMGGFKFAGESNIIAALREAMVENGITMHIAEATLIGHELLTTSGGKPQCLSRWLYRWRFACGTAEGEYIDVMTPAEALDMGDKGYNKTITASKKYALLTTFLLETGNDPDAAEDKREPSAPPRQPSTQPPRSIPNARVPAASQGQNRATPAQVGLLQKLAREYDNLRKESGSPEFDKMSFLGQWGVDHTNLLNPKQASEAIDLLQKHKTDWVSPEPPDSAEIPPLDAYTDDDAKRAF